MCRYRRLSTVAQDCWSDKYHQVGFDFVYAAASEQRTDQWDAAENRHLLRGLSKSIFHQATQDQYSAILDDDGRLYRALIRDQVGGACRSLANTGDFLRNLQQYRVALIDLRCDRQLHANLFALNGLKRIYGTARTTGIGKRARYKRHFLSDVETSFLVVRGHDGRRRYDVGCGVPFQGAQNCSKAGAVVHDAANADSDSFTEDTCRARIDGITLGRTDQVDQIRTGTRKVCEQQRTPRHGGAMGGPVL